MKFLAMHITNKKKRFDIYSREFNMILEKSMYFWQLLYKYNRVTYDWLCAPGSQIRICLTYFQESSKPFKCNKYS